MNASPDNDEGAAPDPSTPDSSTFDKLYDEHALPVFKYVAYRVRDKRAIEEITQNIWTAVCVNLERRSTPSDWKRFIWGITRHKLSDWRRDHKKRAGTVSMDPEDLAAVAREARQDPDLAEIDEKRRILQAVQRALDEVLTSRQREAVTLRYRENLQLKEVAAIMEVSRSVAKEHVKCGIRALQKSLREAGFIVPKEAQ